MTVECFYCYRRGRRGQEVQVGANFHFHLQLQVLVLLLLLHPLKGGRTDQGLDPQNPIVIKKDPYVPLEGVDMVAVAREEVGVEID